MPTLALMSRPSNADLVQTRLAVYQTRHEDGTGGRDGREH